VTIVTDAGGITHENPQSRLNAYSAEYNKSYSRGAAVTEITAQLEIAEPHHGHVVE